MNDLMKQCAASGQMSARQIADEMAESRAEVPAGDKAFFDWWPFAFDPECDGMALEAWNAATAAKDADYALGVSMLTTEITALKTQLTHAHQEIQAYDLTMDKQAKEIEELRLAIFLGPPDKTTKP